MRWCNHEKRPLGAGMRERLSGDERKERFEKAYGALFEPILGYVARRVVDPEDAAEVVAETFLTLWRRLDDAPDGLELRPWLYGVARRTVANHRRGQRRRTALAARLAADLRATPLSPASTSDDQDLDDAAAQAFKELRPSDREVLSLVAWEGLSHEELAVALGVGRPVVRLRLYRARRRFSDALRRAELQRNPGLGHVEVRRASARPGTTEGKR
jgi:RNA polymerase sigma factor (sigma-70 family)